MYKTHIYAHKDKNLHITKENCIQILFTVDKIFNFLQVIKFLSFTSDKIFIFLQVIKTILVRQKPKSIKIGLIYKSK